MRLSLALIVGFCAALSASIGHAETLHSTNFNFGKGRPFGGLVTLGDVRVQLVTTNTEPWGGTGFRDQETGVPAVILFCFNRPVDEFRISFSRILAGETLREFTAGPPTRLEGDLIAKGELEFTVPPAVGDYGKGTMIWKGLDSDVFGFVIDNRPRTATAVDGFALSASHSGNNTGPDNNRGAPPASNPCDFLNPDGAGKKGAN
jgi:hypothetical protein